MPNFSCIPPASPLDNEKESWYIISWGLLTRDRLLSSATVTGCCFLQKPSDDSWAIEPIYFARTFEDALKYLPLCEAFQDAFALDDTGRWVNKKPLYYVMDNDSEIYYTSEAAKNACQRQPDNGVIYYMVLALVSALFDSCRRREEAGAFTFGAENSGVVDVHRGVYGGVTRGWGGSGMVLVWQRHGLWLCVVAEVRLAAEAVGRGAVLAQKGSGAEAKCIEWWRSGCGCATDLPYHHARQFL
ncbi:hypothetical protein DFH08DRAFT_802437 [Mycena albidolilacea]|uniref:Uncharacterized protein n=1 Tax=Mycena albidolilacea TaxID=1033008 RepID=A0AAD7AHD1_9AGAR|nr:hypothetical protein DFH08DRAFT_802437 [Mycena albidolilacea]